QVSVMRVDWAKWRGLGVTGRVSPRFAHLMRGIGTTPANAGPATSTLAALAGAAIPDRRAILEPRLREKIARVLGTPPDRLDAETPLLRLGVDSLMSVELLNWIEAEL